METKELAQICKALGDPTRLKIVEMLKGGTKCACVLLKEFKITQPTLSYHMKSLLSSGIVTCERDGKWCNYSIDPRKMTDVVEYLSAKPISNALTCGCSNKKGNRKI